MIWNEFNGDRIFKKFIKHDKQCLLRIVRIPILKVVFKYEYSKGAYSRKYLYYNLL